MTTPTASRCHCSPVSSLTVCTIRPRVVTIEFELVLADVFTRPPFGGVPLAVLPDARGLTDHRMQDVAAKFGVEQAAFVLTADSPHRSCRVRTFARDGELSLSIRAALGAAAVLAARTELLLHIEDRTGLPPVLANPRQTDCVVSTRRCPSNVCTRSQVSPNCSRKSRTSSPSRCASCLA
ncbi:PhzF family phenazine biosynthesis protein [Nocardia gipuzkoensis]